MTSLDLAAIICGMGFAFLTAPAVDLWVRPRPIGISVLAGAVAGFGVAWAIAGWSIP